MALARFVKVLLFG